MTGTEVSAGARSLLRIASDSGNEAAVSANYTLFQTLDRLIRLHEGATRKVLTEAVAQFRPKHMLGVAAAISLSIYEDQNRVGPADASTQRPLLTRFDAHVHQALAQTLADVTWPDREEGDPPTGPGVEEFLTRLASQSRRTVVEAFVLNYVGNILQHFFSAAEVRRQRPDLPNETETELRSIDARIVAKRVMTLLRGEAPTPSEISSILGFAIAEEASE
jgi:hypothetical protein